MTDHTATHDCGHDWCVAPHEPMCDCAFAQIQPHRAADCARRDAGTAKPTDARPASQEGAR